MTTVIFKPTEACNGNCAYCDVVRKDREKGARLPLETLERFFIRVNEYLAERPDERFQIIWHGGEPLLLGPDYFLKAHEFEQRHCPGTKDRISHDIQTNITLLSRGLHRGLSDARHHGRQHELRPDPRRSGSGQHYRLGGL